MAQDVLLYCDKVETALRYQNQKLADELQDCKREKRGLEAKLQSSQIQTEWVTKENENIRVWH